MAETKQDQPASVLRYTGRGSFLPDVPARDLTADDLAALAEVDAQRAAEAPKDEAPPRRDRKALVKSGLYEPVAAKDDK